MGILLAIASVVMVAYHMVSTQYLLVDPIIHLNIHYMLALIIIFLNALKGSSKYRFVWIVFLIAGLISTNYVNIFFDDLTLRQGSPTTSDLIIGSLLVVLAAVATWRTWGLAIPILASVFFLYALTAESWPAVISGYAPSFERYISMLSIGLTGMYGSLLTVSANYIFLFMVFGALLAVSGVTEWFNDVGKLVGRYSQGGPAQTAIVSSCLFGMISGSAAANAAVTGTFTIPLMKSVGVPPEKAGAVEAAASSGGQIMPPVMGAAAFVMAEILGVSYARVCAWAAIPALLYYFSLFVDVEFTARKLKLVHAQVPFNWSEFLLRLPLFIVPVFLLIYLFVQGHSASYSAFMAIAALLILCSLRRKTRPTWKKLVDGLVSGARSGSEIAVVSAVLAPIWVTMTVTGLGLKLPSIIGSLAGGNLIAGTCLVMVISLILGMGVPTLAAYLLVALAAAPALVKMGTIAPAAHLAAMYYAVFSAVTPPFAIAAMVTSKIAKSRYWPTGGEAIKLSILALILPFLFVYNPQVMGIDLQLKTGVLTFVGLILGIVFLGAGKVGFLLDRLRWWEAMIALISGLLYVYYVATLTSSVLIIAVLVSGVFFIEHWMRVKSKNVAAKIAH